MFIDAIVIAKDRSRTYVHILTEFGIPDVGEVAGLGSFANNCVLRFYKISNLRVFFQYSTGPDSSVGTNACSFANICAFDNRAWKYVYVIGYRAVFDANVSPDLYAIA